MRRILKAIKAGDVVILFPEGGNVSDFQMRSIQPGVGELLRRVDRSKVPIMPISVVPNGKTFSIIVSPQLRIDEGAAGDEIEHDAGFAIANRLPDHLRGPYGDG